MTEAPKSGPTDDAGARRALHEQIAGKWISEAIAVGAELGIPDILKDGPRSVAEIANAAGASEDAVRRLLRALASVSILSSEPDGRFALTASAQLSLVATFGVFARLGALLGHAVTWRPWGELAYSVRTGKPAFDHVFGSPVFDYVSRHPDAAAVVNQAMTSSSAIDADAVVQAYDISGIRTLVDVGGGQGLLLAAILKANPDMRVSSSNCLM